jgi:TonB-linked SusC/RagA family outer membrane protein
VTASFVGYADQTRQGIEVQANQTTTVNFTLQRQAAQLDEVVAIGYGEQQRRDVAGSISSVSAAETEDLSLTSPEQALQGKVAGVQVTQTSNAPGGGVSVRIRGTNSISGDTQPLYVINGVPVYSNNRLAAPGDVLEKESYFFDSSVPSPVQSRTGTGNQTALGAPNIMSTISPNDIESIEVLKDAAATSIYGARGANGVVLITTKEGRANQDRVNFSSYVGGQRAIDTYDVLGAPAFVDLANTAAANQPGGDTLATPYPGGSYANTNWQDQILRTGMVQSYSLSLSGGDPNTQYRVSGEYFNEEGAVIGSQFDRYSLRFSLNQRASDLLRFGTNLTLSRSDNDQSEIIGDALSIPPVFPVRRDNGDYFVTVQNDLNNLSPELGGGSPVASGIQNPVAQGQEAIREVLTTRGLGSAFSELSLLNNNLVLRAEAGADLTFTDGNRFTPGMPVLATDVLAKNSERELITWFNENTLTYSNIFDDRHDLTLLAGQSLQRERVVGTVVGTSDFNNNYLKYYFPFGGDNTENQSSIAQESSLASFFGRANYIFDDKYILSLNARYDGSSKFGTDNKWGFFPAAAVGWRLSDEPFVENLGIFDNLKLRASYGITGNQGIPSYLSLQTIRGGRVIVDNEVRFAYAPGNIAPNPDLGWEETSQLDVGLDVGVLNQRLSLTADYYYKKTTDLLFEAPQPLNSGFGTQWQNVGSMENEGFELSLTSYNVVGDDFQWTTNGNVSFTRNEVLDLYQNTDIIVQNSLVREGRPIGSFYVHEFAGIWQSAEQIAEEGPTNLTALEPGDARYADRNGDGRLDGQDRYVAGSPIPDATFGLTNTFEWRQFDLSVFLQGAYGHDVINFTRQGLERLDGGSNALEDAWENRWRPDNPSDEYTRATVQDVNRRTSDRYVEDGSYVRLRNATLGYEIPPSFLQRWGVQQARLYVSAQNLFTLTGYSGLDPDVNEAGQTSFIRGYDSSAYPLMRQYRAGVSLGF